MIIDDNITNKAPDKVLILGTSFQNKYPNNIPKTKARYFKGVTRETSENLYDWLNHKFATPPNIPTKDSKAKWFKLGITQPFGIVKKLNKVIDNEK